MVVWVCGASSGLGLHTVQSLKKAGMTVISGARSYRQDSGSAYGERRLYLDVTDPTSADAFAARAFALCGAPDALICCAGVLTLGACEEYGKSELQSVMETNFLGQAAMVSRVLPLMRKQRHGKILLFSSINGVLGIPFQGAYVASKHAVEGYAECLRMEARPFGVEVCVVEPGDHQSGSACYRRRAVKSNESSPYFKAYRAACRKIDHDERNGSDPDILGDKIAKALLKKRLPAKLIIASLDQKAAVLMHKILPARLFSNIIASYYR